MQWSNGLIEMDSKYFKRKNSPETFGLVPIMSANATHKNEADYEDSSDLVCEDWKLELAYYQRRHVDKVIADDRVLTGHEPWRLKERMKTVSVALVLCLNVGVDPPDVVKTQPCAKLECWTDPYSILIDPYVTTPAKAIEGIAENLQKQYERWQPRARYKQSRDPTVDDVKKLCLSLRRNAKEERVLFHYNGHGVPKPTSNGEIWLFNKSYTQYIPLAVYDLQTWMGTPSIYIFDCSNAGIILDVFKNCANQHEQEFEKLPAHAKAQILQQNNGVIPNFHNCIQLAACSIDETLPMNPELPADLFTSCITTPIKTAVRWFIMQDASKLFPHVTAEMTEHIPGLVNDRRTVLGELNWIFTAITDTIAWNVLPRDLFQRLFRQDLLVASMFRNFLLAERVMRYYNCHPTTCPKLPSMYNHPMWKSWDLAMDLVLTQLPGIIANPETYEHSPFFAHQLTAFQVWLTFNTSAKNSPEQLPIVLQVLLSQVHRLRALDLLGRFLDLGPWAVFSALSVGIFPYVLKLLQSSARELRPLLVFIWAKVLAVDVTCQVDLVREHGQNYFLSVLEDTRMPSEHRMLAAFVLAQIVDNNLAGQEAAMKGNVISICLDQLNDPNQHMRQWLAICLGRVWSDYEDARWRGVRDTAHEKLFTLLEDCSPEVRAAAVFALGKFIGGVGEHSDQANTINHNIGIQLLNKVAQDGSPLVRKELIVSLHYLVLQYETQFIAVLFAEDEMIKDQNPNSTQVMMNSGGGWPGVTTGVIRRAPGERVRNSSLNTSNGSIESTGSIEITNSSSTVKMRRAVSISSISSTVNPYSLSYGIGVPYASNYIKLWQGISALTSDPHPDVSKLAKIVIKDLREKAYGASQKETLDAKTTVSASAPSSPSNRPSFLEGESPPANMDIHRRVGNPHQQRQRKLTDRTPNTIHEEPNHHVPPKIIPLISTDFVHWCCKYLAQPVMKLSDEMDPESDAYREREWKYSRNARIRKAAEDELKRAATSRPDNQIFINKNTNTPSVLRFHPYEPYLAVTDKDYCSLWNWEQGTKIGYFNNTNPQNSRITSMDFLNSHDHSLIMMGTDDGVVRVWKNYLSDDADEPELITAYYTLTDMLYSSRGAGLILEWEQENCLILATGDVKIVRIWDCEKELKVKDIPTGADSCVTSMSLGGHTFVTGFGDGSIRIYDRRKSTNDCRVATMREHGSWVVNVCMCKRGEFSGKIISGSVAGDVKVWDPRMNTSIKTYQTPPAMTAMAVHPNADIFACGSVNQFISVYSYFGENLSLMKYHDGFMGQRIGPVSCLSFHPCKVNLAAGSTDSIISVYAPEKRI